MEELLHGVKMFALYLIPFLTVMMAMRIFFKVPDELFRKLLHFVLLGGYVPMLFAFEHWWVSAGFAASLMALLYPALVIVSRIPNFSAFANERKKGEFKSSMVLALLTMVMSITVCWGMFGDRLLTLACVYAWGVGDAFAALIGKRFGKHKVRLPFADSKKSWEGSVAMFLSAVVSVLAVLLVRGGLGFGKCLLIAVPAAVATTYTELCTKGGWDTITCPAAAMAVILPLVAILN